MLYILNRSFFRDYEISQIVILDTLQIQQNTDSMSTLKVKIGDKDDTFNKIKNGDIVECDGDYFIINSIKKDTNHSKQIDATQYTISRLKSLYWDNTFKIINPSSWEPSSRCSINCFYIYNKKTYLCIKTHTTTAVFESENFNDLTGQQSNNLFGVSCQEALDQLFVNVKEFEITTDITDITDVVFQKGSLFQNLSILKDVYNAELYCVRNKIMLVKKAGKNKMIKKDRIITQDLSEDISSVVNKLLVLGRNSLTIESVNNGKKYLEDVDSINLYGEMAGEYNNTSIMDLHYLKNRGAAELSKLAIPKITINISYHKEPGDDFKVYDSVDYNGAIYRVQSVSSDNAFKHIVKITLTNQLINTNILKPIVDKIDKEKNEISDRIDNIDTDYVIDKVIDTVKFETVSVENAHIMNAWIKNAFIDRIETNSFGRDIRNPDLATLEGTTYRKYIIVKDQNVYMMVDRLDLSQTETLKIVNPVTMLEDDLIPVYYTAINKDPDAYKYYTTTKPSVLNSSIREDQNELYEVKCYKIIERYEKGCLGFGNEGDLEPSLRFGADPTYGQMEIRKYADKATISWAGVDLEIVPQQGVRVNNVNIGEAGGFISNIFFGTGDPGEIGSNGDIYIKIE